jgi:hypothetical protein
MLNSKIWKLLILVAVFTLPVYSQEAGQKTFDSPEAAATALYEAANSTDAGAVVAVLGASSQDVIHSGDPVQDSKARQNFIMAYDQMNRIGKQTDGSRVLYIGVDNWPFPIALKQTNGKWYFDTFSGKQEILFRRIGKNEYAALRVLNALADAQFQYRDLFAQYTDKWNSSEGQKDGLYWPASAGEIESPIGPLIAYAAGEGYTRGEGPTPFHGYLFRILNAQGANAKGGAKSYLVNGKMTGGFAFVAYPAEYRGSGVMTFLINQDGYIFEKDLGQKTADAGKAMTGFNPDKTWKRVAESEVVDDEEAE